MGIRTNHNRENLIEKIKDYRLFDDVFMSRVFSDNTECTELILNIILKRNDIKVKNVSTQHEIKNLLGRSLRLDIKAVDTDNNQLNIEVQRDSDGASFKRARYHSSMLDANTVIEDKYFKSLPENYVIFITEKDVVGDGLPVYNADRVILETGKRLGDGSHIIYVNGEYRNQENAIGKLMHDFSCTKADDMNYELLANHVRYLKETQKGVDNMGLSMDELIEIGLKEGREEEKKRSFEEKIQIVKNLISTGLSIEQISKCIDIDMEILKELETKYVAATTN